MSDEQRVTLRMVQYWELLKKGKPLPDMKHFNPSTVQDVWPYCMQISIGGGQHPVYKYEYMGEPVAELYGGDLTNMVVDHRMMEFPGSVIHRKFDQAVKTGVMVKSDGHLLNKENRVIKYRACILPFGTEKDGITHLVVGLSCRIF